jgi:hypothetical protein
MDIDRFDAPAADHDFLPALGKCRTAEPDSGRHSPQRC